MCVCVCVCRFGRCYQDRSSSNSSHNHRPLQASAAVGATHVGDWALENSKQLRMTVGADTVPNLMRKYARAGAKDDEIERLYRLEASVRGANSHSGFYELSKVFKRSGSVARLQQLLTQAAETGVEVKEAVREDVEQWLAKRLPPQQ